MSHEIESMISVVQTPWHKLGVILTEPPSIEDAIVAAGLDWEVTTEPLFRRLVGTAMQSVEAQATVRSSDGSVLGVVGPRYTPIQNREAFDFFQPYIERGDATIETAGSLRNGRRVWVLCKIGGSATEIVPGDAVEQYALLSNSHDGTTAARVGFTGIRVVCANTLSYAHRDASSRLLSVRHTKNASDALEQIREIMDVARGEFSATAEQMRTLAQKGVDEQSLRDYVRLVFAPKSRKRIAQPQVRVAPARLRVADDSASLEEQQAQAEAEAETEALTECKRVEKAVVRLFEEGRGSEYGRGTYWNAYNAVTEYISHERGTSPEKRLEAQWLGEGATIARRALDTAVRLAA